MDTSIELRYAGVVIGRATAAGDIDGESLFLAVPDPLPVGSRVSLKIDDRTLEGRVVHVQESTDLTRCGMTVKLGPPSAMIPAPAASAAAAPSPAAAASPAPPATTAPVTDAVPVQAAAPAPPVEQQGSVDEVTPEMTGAQSDGTGGGAANSDGPASADESSHQPGGGGGGRRRRRKR